MPSISKRSYTKSRKNKSRKNKSSKNQLPVAKPVRSFSSLFEKYT